ncbi:helix-turn-helix domain-containing protein [Nocardioides bizhenqiangii]|uniref:Helix-turn-helix transcriptional regulator n=1 Tax=Nocardioides bizhenqiangii TaxID=3095076 RepID=A0ABZ0ZKM0_9ACTN|nr:MULTISPECIES: helix-turn-helix transcriptional regulator [unclassified Nocardioides]MDZ5620526.1 helix-turn-helix transcriptional regulator [Nocardioides sp. HM23]WQQ24897.1 helix-turn-helix transcriptional regulator [Nocardioides sp. HM61]
MSEAQRDTASAAAYRHLQVVGPAYAEAPPPALATAGWTGRLSRREKDVLRLLAAGQSTVEIGRTLFISPATVKCHVARLIAKVGVRDRVQLVVAAYRSGFVQVD